MADAQPDQGSDSTTEQKTTVVLGMHLGRIDATARKQFSLSNEIKGAVVTAVDPNSPAGDAELRPGDVIRQVGHAEASAPKVVASAVAEAKKSGRPSVLLLVNRGGADLFVALHFPPG